MKAYLALAVFVIPSLALAAPSASKPKPAAKAAAPVSKPKPAIKAGSASSKPAAAGASKSAASSGTKSAPAEEQPAPVAASPTSKLPPSSQHAPAVILDEASVQLSLNTRGDEGYDFKSHVEMTGFTSKTDTARIDWKQGGKVLATAKCKLDLNGKNAEGSCDYGGKPLKAKGDIQAELVYWDDQTEKEYLVRTFNVKAYEFKGQWETWQIVPDDVLASGWIYMGHDNDNNGTYRRPSLYLWFSNGDYLNDATFRCTVEGKKLPDFEASPQGGSDTGVIEADHQPTNGDRLTYRWQKTNLLMGIMWGKRETLKYDMPKTQPKDTVLSDLPGKWECALRHDGKAIRQVLFTVDKDGMILQDEIQTGKNAIPVVSNRVALIDLRLTKDSEQWDKRIVPAALKKSMGFGLPWPVHPKVSTIQASYPPKSGMPDPN
jgi:hypothetical protein